MTKVIDQKTGQGDETAVYRHWGHNGKLLYVGVAKDPSRRSEAHSTHSGWWPLVVDVTVEWHPTRSAALSAERDAIFNEAPLFNSVYARSPAPNVRRGVKEAPADYTPTMTNTEFKAIRQQLGLTQAQLADVLGYHGAMAVSVYERASNPRPVPPLLAKLMEAYRDGYRPNNWPHS